MNMETIVQNLIRDWRALSLPKASSPTYLVQLAAFNQRQKDALDLETELRVFQAQKLLRRK